MFIFIFFDPRMFNERVPCRFRVTSSLPILALIGFHAGSIFIILGLLFRPSIKSASKRILRKEIKVRNEF